MDLVNYLKNHGCNYVIQQLSNASTSREKKYSREEAVFLFQKIRFSLSDKESVINNNEVNNTLRDNESDIWQLLFELRRYFINSKYGSIDNYSLHINGTKCSVYDYLQKNEIFNDLIVKARDSWEECIKSTNGENKYAEFLKNIFDMVDQKFRYFDWGKDIISAFLKENINEQLNFMLAVIEIPKDSSGYAEFIWKKVFPYFLRYINLIFDENILKKSDFYFLSVEICNLTHTCAIEDKDRKEKSLLMINRFQRHLLNSLEYLFPVMQNTSEEMADDSITPVDDIRVLDSADNTQSPPYSPQLRYKESIVQNIIETDEKSALSPDKLESENSQFLIQ